MGLVVGGIATPRITFLLGGQEALAAVNRLDYAALGLVGGFVAFRASFLFFLVGILIAVTLIHQRHPRTLVTAREKISWRRVGHGFVAWFVPVWLIAGLGQYLFYPDTFSFNFDLTTFALFVPIALIVVAIQTTTEELFFRGYIVQGASIVWSNRVFLALVPAVIFALTHLLNPEASAGGWLTVFINYFLVPGLVWTVVSLIDGTTELAIGARSRKRRERTDSVHNQRVPRDLHGAVDAGCRTRVSGDRLQGVQAGVAPIRFPELPEGSLMTPANPKPISN